MRKRLLLDNNRCERMKWRFKNTQVPRIAADQQTYKKFRHDCFWRQIASSYAPLKPTLRNCDAGRGNTKTLALIRVICVGFYRQLSLCFIPSLWVGVEGVPPIVLLSRFLRSYYICMNVCVGCRHCFHYAPKPFGISIFYSAFMKTITVL